MTIALLGCPLSLFLRPEALLYCAFVIPSAVVLAPRGPLYRPFVGLYVSELYAFWISFFWRIWQLCACSRMSAVLEGTSSNNKEDESVLLAEIED